MGRTISILLAVGTPSTGSGNLYCQWELSPGSGNALCILFPTDVTMTMAQTLIKLKAEKAKLLDEQIAQKLHDEEQNLKKKPVSVAQAKKNMIICVKNMASYKLEFFRGMTYDKVRPIFEREYKKVQTFFKPDKDVEEPKKKRVADETLLQESFKNLRADEVSGSESTQEIPFNDPKEMTEEDVQNMLEIFPVEDIVALWNLIKEKFSSTESSVDKEKALWVELKRLFEPDADDVLWKLQRYMHAPLTWKLYTDCGKEGTVTFKKDNKKITFNMPHKMEAFSHIDFKDVNTDSKPPFVLENKDDRGKTYYSDSLTLGPKYREDESISKEIRHLIELGREANRHKGEVTKFLIKNEEEFFTDAGDGVRIISDSVIFVEKKIGSS
nr:hypothetical protein [Tanacetum cinerariifolium]